MGVGCLVEPDSSSKEAALGGSSSSGATGLAATGLHRGRMLQRGKDSIGRDGIREAASDQEHACCGQLGAHTPGLAAISKTGQCSKHTHHIMAHMCLYKLDGSRRQQSYICGDTHLLGRGRAFGICGGRRPSDVHGTIRARGLRRPNEVNGTII